MAVLTALKLPLYPVLSQRHEIRVLFMLSDRSNQSNQTEASVEPVESAGVEVVAPIPIPEYVNELVTRAKACCGPTGYCSRLQ